MKYGHHSQWQKRATLLFWDQILRFGWNSSREEQSVKAYFCFDNLKNASSFQLEPVCLPCQGISATRFLLKKEHSELINQTLKLWSHLLKYTRVSKQTVLVVFAMVNAVIFSMSCACRKLALSSSWDSSASSFSALASESQKKKAKKPILFLIFCRNQTKATEMHMFDIAMSQGLFFVCLFYNHAKASCNSPIFYFMIYKSSTNRNLTSVRSYKCIWSWLSELSFSKETVTSKGWQIITEWTNSSFYPRS